MPRTRPANIHASPSRRSENVSPACGSQSRLEAGTCPPITAGVSHASRPRPSSGAAAAIHATVRRDAPGASAMASAAANGKARSRFSIGNPGWAGRRDAHAPCRHPSLADGRCRGVHAILPPMTRTSIVGPRTRPQRATSPGRALVFGGSGQIGRPLLALLVQAGWEVHALSRLPQPAADGVRWLRGDLATGRELPAEVDLMLSCGPLDAFAARFARADVACARVLAFGSTSVEVKRDSPDAGERDIARRLREAEAQLFGAAAARGIAATVLRPTLVYGAGRDATLTRIAALARRLRGFALPSDATGLRQPVHVDDLAAAAMACLDAPATHGRAYAVPG